MKRCGEFFPTKKYPQQDSNLRSRLRRPVLYPLSYGGNLTAVYHNWRRQANQRVLYTNKTRI